MKNLRLNTVAERLHAAILDIDFASVEIAPVVGWDFDKDEGHSPITYHEDLGTGVTRTEHVPYILIQAKGPGHVAFAPGRYSEEADRSRRLKDVLGSIEDLDVARVQALLRELKS